MNLLINKQLKSYENTKICYIYEKNNLKVNMLKTKNIVRTGRTVIIQSNVEILPKAYVIKAMLDLKKFLYLFTMNLTIIIILS